MPLVKGWQFPLNGNGSAQGFNDGAIDTFSGRRLSAMVREVIQNSLDAYDNNASGPVTVYFSLQNVSKKHLCDLDGLASHLKKCEEMAMRQELEAPREFYVDAINLIKSDTVPVLAISDFNTKGLTGPIDDEYGPWFALTKGMGVTQKPGGEGSLGSFGHGSKAPFAMSKLRALYYLSETVNPDGGNETRFQGKGILQTHKHPVKNESTQGVGFYGDKDTLRPLINDEIPGWAKAIRASHSEGYGTTILIPHTRFREDLFPETKITVIANFFYAIYTNQLRVIVDGEVIDNSNVEDWYQWSLANIESEQDEIDTDYIRECFKSIETIINPDEFNKTKVKGFGQIDWYLRVNEDINPRAVAISRQSGMIITRKPVQLARFPGMMPFDMFVFVNKGGGSDVLKKLENPAHDNFEFDRIQGRHDENEVKKLYSNMTHAVRTIIKQFATPDTDDEVLVKELSEFMFDIGNEDSDKGVERGNKLLITEAPKKRVKSVKSGKGSSSGQQKSTGFNIGQNESKGTNKRKTSGSFPGGNTETEVLSGADGESPEKPSKSSSQVEKLRITPVKDGSNSIVVHYSFKKPGTYNFFLVKVGESESSPVSLLYKGKDTSSLTVKLDSPGRKTLKLTFSDPSDSNYAYEGWLDAIS